MYFLFTATDTSQNRTHNFYFIVPKFNHLEFRSLGVRHEYHTERDFHVGQLCAEKVMCSVSAVKPNNCAISLQLLYGCQLRRSAVGCTSNLIYLLWRLVVYMTQAISDML